METRVLAGRRRYDGSQLSSHWIYRTCGIAGDACVAFRGPCDVAESEMADLADLLQGPGIRGDDMVHVVWECFGDRDLLAAVLRQRLLAALARDLVVAMARRGAGAVRRDGDDLWLDGVRGAAPRKLSISVATVTPVSTVIHFAINVTARGVPPPVKAAGLADLGIEPGRFGRALLKSVAAEMRSAVEATTLVRGKS